MASGTVSFDPRTALVVVDLQNDLGVAPLE